MHVELIDTKLVHSSLSIQRTHACLAEVERNRKATWECVRKCRGAGNYNIDQSKGLSAAGDTGDWGNACLHFANGALVAMEAWESCVGAACLPLTDIPSGIREL